MPVDPSRYRPLVEAAHRRGLAEPTLRRLTYSTPGLGVRVLGRVYVDLERLDEVLKPRPMATAGAKPLATG